jgi:hypothetical protein
MFKHTQRKLAFTLFLVLLAGPVDRVFASGTGSTSISSPASAAQISATPDGPTGTDPEPIEPDIVSVILALLHLA